MNAATGRLFRPARRSLLLALVSSLIAAGGCGVAAEDADSTEGAQTSAAPAV